MQDVNLLDAATIRQAHVFNPEDVRFIILVGRDLSPMLRNNIEVVNYIWIRDCAGYEQCWAQSDGDTPGLHDGEE